MFGATAAGPRDLARGLGTANIRGLKSLRSPGIFRTSWRGTPATAENGTLVIPSRQAEAARPFTMDFHGLRQGRNPLSSRLKTAQMRAPVVRGFRWVQAGLDECDSRQPFGRLETGDFETLRAQAVVKNQSKIAGRGKRLHRTLCCSVRQPVRRGPVPQILLRGLPESEVWERDGA